MEVTIGGNTYRIGKMPTYPQQFHVARRLAPAVWALGASVAGVVDDLKSKPTGDVVSALGPVAEVLAKMTDADSEYVMNTCLDCVSKKEGEKWAPIRAKGGGLMFENLGMPEMMRLVFAVIKENLGDFFPDAPPPDAPGASTASS